MTSEAELKHCIYKGVFHTFRGDSLILEDVPPLLRRCCLPGIGRMASWKVDLKSTVRADLWQVQDFSNPARDLSRT